MIRAYTQFVLLCTGVKFTQPRGRHRDYDFDKGVEPEGM